MSLSDETRIDRHTERQTQRKYIGSSLSLLDERRRDRQTHRHTDRRENTYVAVCHCPMRQG